MPTPHKGEPHDKWIDRCMGNDEQNKSFPDEKQRYAVCESLWRNKDKKKTAMTTNLATFAEKLTTGKWLIKPAVHTKLCKQVDGYMKNPVPLADDLVPPNDYIPSTDDSADGVHAIIHVQGILSKNVSEEAEQLLGLVDVDWIGNLLDATANDPFVKDIILCFNSPGGETTGIEELGRKIVEIDTNIKPVYSFTANQADSAAYWLYSQGRFCGMCPSAQCAGVGVYVLVLDETRKMKMEGCEIIPISSGKYKLLGHEFHELTKEEKNIIQEDVDKQHNKFKQTILARRPNISESDLEGLSFNGEDALEKKLVDVLVDNIDDFIAIIESNGDMYNNMKPQVETKAVKTNATSPVEVTSTKVEPVAKKLSFIEKLKQLMGDYDKGYAEEEEEDLPGLPGVKENTPTNYTENDNAPGDGSDEVDDDNDEGEKEEMNYMEEIASLKKALAELQTKFDAKSEAEPPKKMEEEEEEEEKKMEEGNYDGGYAEKKAESPKVELTGKTSDTDKLPLSMPTQEEFMKMCGLGVAIKPKALSEWEKICSETFTGKIFDTVEKK